jgi:hypothetical protein
MTIAAPQLAVTKQCSFWKSNKSPTLRYYDNVYQFVCASGKPFFALNLCSQGRLRLERGD